MSEPRKRYIAYLLRLWQVWSEAGSTWRASLESAQGGERLGFTGLDELLEFLRRRTAEEEKVEEKQKDRGRQR